MPAPKPLPVPVSEVRWYIARCTTALSTLKAALAEMESPEYPLESVVAGYGVDKKGVDLNRQRVENVVSLADSLRDALKKHQDAKEAGVDTREGGYDTRISPNDPKESPTIRKTKKAKTAEKK